MTITNEELDELERLARRAPMVPWSGATGIYCGIAVYGGTNEQAAADFIAHANPERTLRLIARVRELEAAGNKYCAHREPLGSGFCPDCEQFANLLPRSRRPK